MRYLKTNEELKEQAKLCLTKFNTFKNTKGAEQLAADWMQAYKDTKGLMTNETITLDLQMELMPNFRGSNCTDFNLVFGYRHHCIEFTYDFTSRITGETQYGLKNSSSLIFTNKKEAKKILNKIKKNLDI